MSAQRVRPTFRDLAKAEIRAGVVILKIVFTFHAGLLAFIAPNVIAYGFANSYLPDLVIGPLLPLVAFVVIKTFWVTDDEPSEAVAGLQRAAATVA